MNLYPLNTFKGETKKELEKMVSKIIDQVRLETIKDIEEELITNIRFDEYVLQGEVGYLTDKKIKDILNKLK